MMAYPVQNGYDSRVFELDRGILGVGCAEICKGPEASGKHFRIYVRRDIY